MEMNTVNLFHRKGCEGTRRKAEDKIYPRIAQINANERPGLIRAYSRHSRIEVFPSRSFAPFVVRKRFTT